MAKLSLPKLEFDKKKAGIAGGVLLLVVVGWLAWDMFMGDPPPPPVVTTVRPPAAKPPAAKPPAEVAPDKPAVEMKAEAVPVEKAAPATPAPVETVAAATAPKQTMADAGPRALTARSKLDARECLKLDTNQAIHRCAEAFR
jgi:hypothetical protein